MPVIAMQQHRLHAASSAVTLIACAAFFFNRSTASALLVPFGICPPLAESRSFVVLEVGANRTSASLEVTLSIWIMPPWRPLLAEELKQGQAAIVFDGDGRVVRCASDVPASGGATAAFLAPAGTPWQWPTEEIGYEHKLRMPPVQFDAAEPVGTGEAAWEAAARASIDDDGGEEGLVLQTLSTSPPIFRVRMLPSEPLLFMALARP